jgi:hypothetical protein
MTVKKNIGGLKLTKKNKIILSAVGSAALATGMAAAYRKKKTKKKKMNKAFHSAYSKETEAFHSALKKLVGVWHKEEDIPNENKIRNQFDLDYHRQKIVIRGLERTDRDFIFKYIRDVGKWRLINWATQTAIAQVVHDLFKKANSLNLNFSQNTQENTDNTVVLRFNHKIRILQITMLFKLCDGHDGDKIIERYQLVVHVDYVNPYYKYDLLKYAKRSTLPMDDLELRKRMMRAARNEIDSLPLNAQCHIRH